jgi:ATP-dependent RNA helicase DDX56/DBP9
MKHVPKYLLPRITPVDETGTAEDIGEKMTGFVPFKKGLSRHKSKNARDRGGRGRSGSKRKTDPLKKFGR